MGEDGKKEEGGETEGGESGFYTYQRISKIEILSFEPQWVFVPQMRWRILSMDSSILTCRTQLVSSKDIAQTYLCKLDSPDIIHRWWEQNEARFLAKGPTGKALVALAKR